MPDKKGLRDLFEGCYPYWSMGQQVTCSVKGGDGRGYVKVRRKPLPQSQADNRLVNNRDIKREWLGSKQIHSLNEVIKM